MTEFSLKPIIMFFLVAVIGLIFLGEIADNQIENTQISSIINETIAITSQTGTLSQDDVVGLSFFGNATNSTVEADVTIGLHVNFTKAGVITVDDMSFPADGDYNASYTYEGDLYVVDTKTHPLLKLLTVFFVLVIFAFGFLAIRQSSDDFNFGFKK